MDRRAGQKSASQHLYPPLDPFDQQRERVLTLHTCGATRKTPTAFSLSCAAARAAAMARPCAIARSGGISDHFV